MAKAEISVHLADLDIVKDNLAQLAQQRDEARARLAEMEGLRDFAQALYERASAEREAWRPVVEAAREYATSMAGVRAHNLSRQEQALIAAVDALPSTPPTQDHRYLSTACLHDRHDQCGVKQAERGEPGPPHCKYCDSVCSCPVCRHAPPTTTGGSDG